MTVFETRLVKISRFMLPAYFIAAALINLMPLVASHRTANDFQNVYVGATMVREGKNPYDDSSLKKEWSDIVKRQNVNPRDSGSSPGWPSPLLYSPNTFGLYAPLSGPRWNTIAPVMKIVSALCVLAFVLVFFRIYTVVNGGKPSLLFVALPLIALNGTSWVIVAANPMAFAALFIGLSFAAYTRGNNAATGIWLGLACIKITIAFPLAVFLFARKRYRALVTALVVACLPLAAFIGHGSLFDTLKSWLGSTRAFTDALLSLTPGSACWSAGHTLLDYISPLNALLSFYTHCCRINVNTSALGAASLLAYAAAVAVLIAVDRKARLDDCSLVALLLCAEFLCNYHLIYDCMILIAFVVVLYEKIGVRSRLALVVATSILYIPFNGLMIRLGVPKEYYLFVFNIPLCIMAIAAVVIHYEWRRARNIVPVRHAVTA
jgi:hypothetical protein